MLDNKENIFFSPLLEDLLQNGNVIQILLTGYSMFPFLMHGDTVQISAVDTEKLKCGDIVVFKVNNRWIAHRLIKKNIVQNIFYTRGDAMMCKDLPVNQGQIKGIVIKAVKSRCKLSRFATGKCSRYIAFFSPVISPVFYLIFCLSGALSKLKKCLLKIFQQK